MKQRGVFLIGFFLISIYYFLFPRPSGLELVLAPLSLTNLLTAEQEIGDEGSSTAGLSNNSLSNNSLSNDNLSNDEVYPVRTGTIAGFVDSRFQPRIMYRSDRLAVAEDWLARVQDGQLSVFTPKNRLLFRLSSNSFPISRDGRLYLYNGERGEISELDPESGELLWSRTKLAPLTVLDAASGRTLIGYLDGRIFIVDRTGKQLLEYRPGGSRVEAIYGAALSSDGKRAVLISGLDPQRFILLEERKNGFRPVAHHDTDTDFRRNVSIGFVHQDSRILHEGIDQIYAIDLEGEILPRLDFPYRPVGWIDGLFANSLLVAGADSNQVSLKLLSGADTMIFEDEFPGTIVWISGRGNRVFLSIDGRLLVMEAVMR